MTLSSGQVLNESYLIESCLGTGGFAVVYKANQIELNRTVAIKMLHDGLIHEGDALARFVREGQILAGLQHPAIVSCFATGIHFNRIPFLVFEFVEGKTLRQILNESKLDIMQFFDLAIQILDALSYAHEKLVVHRDLKPENLMVIENEGDKQAKILDFGLARIFDDKKGLTKSGLLIGSAAYMSPEQCAGAPVDGRSDIYSLSCILYECLAKVRPHEADTAVAYVFKHINETPVPLREFRKDLPPALDLMIFKGLAKDPADRYQTAAAFCDDLRKLKHSIISSEAFTLSAVELSPKLQSALGNRNSNRFKRGSSKIYLIGFLIMSCLVFGLSDPGPAAALDYIANFGLLHLTAKDLESSGDWLNNNRRTKAAIIFYRKANDLLPTKEYQSRMRLSAKNAMASFEAGNTPDAQAGAVKCYEILFDSLSCENLDKTTMDLLLQLAEKCNFNPGPVYEKLLALSNNKQVKQNYKQSFFVNFSMCLCDKVDSKNAFWPTVALFRAVDYSQSHRDSDGLSFIFRWVDRQRNRFGSYKRLISEFVSNAKQNSRMSALDGAINVVLPDLRPQTGSPEKLSFLLAAVIGTTIDTDHLERILLVNRLLPWATAKKNSEEKSIAFLILSIDAFSKQETKLFYHHAAEAINVLPKIDDTNSELNRSYCDNFPDEVFNVVYLLQSRLRDERQGRMEMLLAMENLAKNNPRMRNSDQLNNVELEIFHELVNDKRYDEAEHLLLTELKRNRKGVYTHTVGYPDLALFYADRKKLPQLKLLLEQAEVQMNRMSMPVESRISLNDAWCTYYRFISPPDYKQARARCQLGLEGSLKLFDGPSIELHKKLLKDFN